MKPTVGNLVTKMFVKYIPETLGFTFDWNKDFFECEVLGFFLFSFLFPGVSPDGGKGPLFKVSLMLSREEEYK